MAAGRQKDKDGPGQAEKNGRIIHLWQTLTQPLQEGGMPVIHLESLCARDASLPAEIKRPISPNESPREASHQHLTYAMNLKLYLKNITSNAKTLMRSWTQSFYITDDAVESVGE